MAGITFKLGPQLSIDKDASDLAFYMGQAVGRDLINRAKVHVSARNDEIMNSTDIETAAAELGLEGLLKLAGEIADATEARARARLESERDKRSF